MNAINPLYPTAEDRAHDRLARQIAVAGAVAKWRRLALETLPDPEEDGLDWPCGGADRKDVVAWLESLEVRMPTMETMMEAVEP